METLGTRLDIVQVISERVALERQNAYWIGVCPWCKVKEFSVSPQRQIFYCFRCKKGGSAQSFINEYPDADGKRPVDPFEGL